MEILESFHCNFSHSNWCHFKNTKEGLWAVTASSDLPDHSKGGHSGYILSATQKGLGQSVRIETYEILVENASCFEFWYTMYGEEELAGDTSLSVILIHNDTEETVWKVSHVDKKIDTNFQLKSTCITDGISFSVLNCYRK